MAASEAEDKRRNARAARAEAEEQLRREVVERAWRESQEYARGVADLRKKTVPPGTRRAPAIAAAIALGAVAIGAVLINFKGAPEPVAPVAPAPPPAAVAEEKKTEPAAESAEILAAKARVEEEARKAAEEKSRLLALRLEEEALKKAQLEDKARADALAQSELLAQADALAKAKSARIAKDAPRTARLPGTVFQDCPDCPRMVVIPAGEFTMGSLASEAERGADEGPPHPVSIERPFALGRGEVTVAQFRRFADESGYLTEAERDTRSQGCSGFIYFDPSATGGEAQQVTSWRHPGLQQEESHPVLCVSWNDARAYARWLSNKTGQAYRLPAEAEWEYAARAGTSAARYWGNDPGQACRFANVADQSRYQTLSFGQKHECNDGHYFTAPAGSYAQNGFGLYDMVGNAWEWTEDCWNASYAGAPADGAAWLAGDCGQRVSRGGSWSTVPRFARSATRNKSSADHRDNLTGFRLARNLE